MEESSGMRRYAALFTPRAWAPVPSWAMDRLGRLVAAAHPVRRAITFLLLLNLLAIPLFGTVSVYQDYVQLRSLGEDALHHLLAAKDSLLPSSGGGASAATGASGCAAPASATPTAGHAAAAGHAATPSPTAGSAAGGVASGTGSVGGLGRLGAPDAAHVAAAQHELQVARAEFRLLGGLLDRPEPTLQLADRVPYANGEIATARQLVSIGDDASQAAITLLTAASPLLARLHAGALANSDTPLMTPDEEVRLRDALARSLNNIDDIARRASTIDPSQMPLNACQRAQFAGVTSGLVQARGLIAQAPALLDALTWMGAVGGERQYLVQMLDRAELRPTGGFTGLLGVLSLVGGRVWPFTLHDVNHFDYGPQGYPVIADAHAPALYSWWPFPKWGLRDASLSADFPTTAQLELQTFYAEDGPDQLSLYDPTVDGVIQLTIVPVQHVLQVTGPIDVPDYGEHVTAANVEQVIHRYQNDQATIAREEAICSVSTDYTQVTKRKCFTEELGALLEQRVRHLSFGQLLTLGQLLLQDLQSHEIEIYVDNTQVEGLLQQLGYASHLVSAPGLDTLAVNQANLSISKDSPLVTETLADDVTLDAQGGATHAVTLTLHYDPSRDWTLYGYSSYTTYVDYVRFYVPLQAQLQDAGGFGASWSAPGYGGWPSNYASDVPGFSMYGGYTQVFPFGTATMTLTYYVPGVALPAGAVKGQAAAYTLYLDRQAGTSVAATIKIHPAKSVAGEATAPVSYRGTLSADVTLRVPRTAVHR